MEEKGKKLQILVNKIAQERGYGNGSVEIKDISSGGANYSSTLHLATISAPDKEDLNLFAKVPCPDETFSASDQNTNLLTKAYETEIVFYTELAVAFQRLYEKHGVKLEDRLNISKYYGHESANDGGILVLENLAAIGFESFDRFKPFDWDYASAAVTQLARFHALGIAAEEEKLEELNSIREIGLDTVALIDVMKESYIKQGLTLGTESVKEEYKARLQKYLTEENLLNDLTKLWGAIDSGFLVHADFRPSNMMHRKRDGKVDLVPLDYQVLHFGALVKDLLYFIWCGSDSKFRQKHYEQTLEHYYAELSTALKNLKIDINEVYPRKTFEKELEDYKTVGLMMGLSMMSALTIEPENAPQPGSIEIFDIKPNQQGLDKMNEVVEDYIRWGII